MDWTSGERRDHLRAVLVDPVSYAVVGELGEVTGGSIVENYDAPTRVSGTVETIAPETYVDLSMVRLIHEAQLGPETYRETLGTFFALRSSGTYRVGTHRVLYDLKSVLYAMQDDYAPEDLTLAKGSTAKAAFARICGLCSRRRSWVDGASDSRWGKAWTLEAGDSYLSWLHQLADRSSNRVDASASGLVTMAAYVRPRDREPIMRLPWNSPLVMSAGIADRTNEDELPSRAIVTWEHAHEVRVRDGVYTSGAQKGQPKYRTKTERTTVTGWADADAGARSSIGRRGYRVSTWHVEDDLGAGKAAAEEKARQYLNREDDVIRRWDVPCFWFPVHEGDVLLWREPDSDSWRRCLVDELRRDLTNWTQVLTLRGV